MVYLCFCFQERSLLISTWVDIGQELRLLKNFSSLKAIISGLQSNSVYRLTKTWAALCKDKVRTLCLYKVLSNDIFLFSLFKV